MAAGNYGSFSTMFRRKRNAKLLLKKVDMAMERANMIIDYVRLNLTAFRKIVKKVDKHLGLCMSHQISIRLMDRSFFLVCGRPKRG